MKKFIGEEIYKKIPNRYPLMILDQLEVETGKYAYGYKTLTSDDWFFACHFPSKPIMPACLLIETMTQVFISIFLQSVIDESVAYCGGGGQIPVLVEIGKIRLREALYPGDGLKMYAMLKSLRHGVARGMCRAYKIIKSGDGDKEILVTEFEVVHALPDEIKITPQSGCEL